jgi:murein DD-endopeptidase MepM/ murein hydrolase activator NlpD
MDGGTTGTIGTLLAASSFSDLTDRIEFASALVQGDADLATRVQSQQQQLQWARQRFAQAASTQRVELGNLAQQRDQIAAGVDRLAAVVDDLKKQLAAEHQAPDPQPRTNGAIELCPVDGPNSFSDSFGDPRPGGRTHQGIDMFASFGTPIVAVHAGNAVRAPNELGGNAVIVYHDGSSDWTYYAHMSSYGAVGNVSAGTVIGYVGATGDTNTNHLHFEYHPGGGAAVDPYQMLLAVC